jgi:predicted nucleic acid-binding protein
MAVEWMRSGNTAAIDDSVELHAPTVIDYEFQSTIRRFARLRMIPAEKAVEALRVFTSMRVVRHPAERFYSRMWDMRDNISTYGAAYVALAEALDIPLMTTDQRLARAAGPYCQVAPL